MSLETTLTTLTELVYGEWINPFILSYAQNYKNPSQFLLRMDPLNGEVMAVKREMVLSGGILD